MQGCIYLIENKVTKEKYIGATTRPVRIRFHEHFKDAKRFGHRPLYQAINEYGIDNFNIITLEVCEEENLPNREKYWIEHYNTFLSDGYNATYGGKGKQLLDNDQIVDVYKETLNQHDTAKVLGCNAHTVNKTLNKMQINTVSSNIVNKNKFGHKVVMIDVTTNEIIKKFDSQIEAGQWLIDNCCTKITDLKKLSYVIGRTVRGLDNRKQAYGYKWQYA